MILRLCRDGLAQHLVNMALAPPKGARHVRVPCGGQGMGGLGRRPSTEILLQPEQKSLVVIAPIKPIVAPDLASRK